MLNVDQIYIQSQSGEGRYCRPHVGGLAEGFINNTATNAERKSFFFKTQATKVLHISFQLLKKRTSVQP